MKKLSLIVCLILLTVQVCHCERPRYISLAPSTTEILFALGLDQEIIGVSSFCNYPPQAKTKSNMGDFSHPNMEKIVYSHPDYIFCTGLEQAPIIRELQRQHLKVYVGDPTNIQGLLNTIHDIGKITGKIKEANQLVRHMEQEIKNLSTKANATAKQRKPKVFIEIWDDPLTTAGKGSFINELIEIAGGINIAYDTKRPYSIFSQEEVLKRNPDCIILTYMSKEAPLSAIQARFGWQNISAVINRQIYNDINPDLLLRPGPRVIEAIEELHKRLFPNET